MNLEHFIISIVSAIIGFTIGFFARDFLDKTGKGGKDAKTLVLVVVTVAWFTSVVVEILNPNYHTSPMIHGLMGSIVGFFYKFEVKPKQGGKK